MIADEISFIEAKKNLNKQATKVLHDIASAYGRGVLDSPRSAHLFCNLLACICEGKVKGTLNESTYEVEWSLTEAFSQEIEEVRNKQKNVFRGPWE